MKGFRPDFSFLEGPHIAMVTTPAEFARRVRALTGEPPTVSWLGNGGHAAVNVFTNSTSGELAILVSMPLRPKSEDFNALSILVHEAVHVFQAWCDYVGEDRPGTEVEAYAIQATFDWLAAEYARRQGKEEKKKCKTTPSPES